MQTAPAKIQGVTFVPASSTSTTITISWTSLAGDVDTGGAAISKYKVESAPQPVGAATPAWGAAVDVAAGSNQYLATGLTGGVTYLFRVTGVNLHGDGAPSDNLPALAAEAPATPSAPSTALVGTSVKVSWTLPSANFAEPITAYDVTIADNQGSFSSDITLCDGSVSPATTDRYCLIPMDKLAAPATPYLLPVSAVLAESLIRFKVRA